MTTLPIARWDAWRTDAGPYRVRPQFVFTPSRSWREHSDRHEGFFKVFVQGTGLYDGVTPGRMKKAAGPQGRDGTHVFTLQQVWKGYPRLHRQGRVRAVYSTIS